MDVRVLQTGLRSRLRYLLTVWASFPSPSVLTYKMRLITKTAQACSKNYARKMPTIQWMVSICGVSSPVNTGGTSWNRSRELGDLSLEHQGDLLGSQIRGPELMMRPQGRTSVLKHTHSGTSLGWESLYLHKKCRAFLSRVSENLKLVSPPY